MCLEDIRLGRKKYSTVRAQNTNADATTPIIGAAKNRTHISISTVGGNNRVTPGELGHDLFAAYVTGIALPPLEFDIETHGNIVQQSWVGSGIGGTGVLLIVETFLEEQ